MIKKLIEQVFQAHQLDVLRKLLGAIESAASQNGWTQHEESICDFIARATKANRAIEKESQGVAYYRELVEAYHAVAGENGREDGELIEDYMVRIWKALDVAQRHADETQKNLQAAYKSIEEKDSEIGKLISLSNERALESGKLKEGHSAGSDGLSSLQIENLKRQLQTAKDDLERQHLREAKISAEYQADIKKILATANKLGRADYESPESFMNRQAADMESQCRQLNLVRQELGDKTQKVLELSRWHEENLEKIKALEAELSHSRSQESPEATRNALRNVTADRDRIRTELAAILAEANKSGRCNGDPVQLLKQGQADLDALTHFEKDNAKLNALVSKLQGELSTAKADIVVLERQLDISAQRVAKTTDEYTALRDRAVLTVDELSKAQFRVAQLASELEAITNTANACGRACEENVSSFIERLLRNNAELRKARDGYRPVEIELRKVQTLMVRIEANTSRAGRADDEDLVDFIWRQQHEKGLAREQSAKEVDRLSALVASLQVELDDATRKYGDIMAALGNETPLEFIDHMKRIGTEQKAALAFEVEELKQTITAKNESLGKMRSRIDAALATVANQSAAIAEAQRVTEKYTVACTAANKLKEWASTVRHKVMVKVVHDKAMQEYDNIIKELDGEATK